MTEPIDTDDAFAAAMAAAKPAPAPRTRAPRRATEPLSPDARLPDPDSVVFNDALDFFEPKTAQQLTTETGLKRSTVDRFLREAEARGTVDRKGNRYRIHHAGKEWK